MLNKIYKTKFFKTIKPKDQLRYHNYPGIQKICKPCKLEASRKHNAKKYKTIKENPIW